MSERYPAISQLIAENRIPEFDCLYLDMNGIIHNCTHKDNDSPTFRMTEDKMFIAIFNYIEHLFSKIKPQKLFFMAIDGVAPRAKMNQQRARRFRTALDAEQAREKAQKIGVEMPKEAAFDSNCITPGTEFMAKLTRQLKYFIAKKVSEDRDWQGVEIVLSGHEVPGEGEHKIMEYIRMAKAQPEYDPNVRHCLYGLDADLIMLGLLSHDPHFCLLREEVTFGRKGTQKSKELEHQNFYLMHLCIVREYLELEFQELKDPSFMSFEFDMERVIDDFILMAFFVGNDFLPNLPNLHINEGALALMFKVYKRVLPKAGGYINERGVINLERLRVLLDELQDVEYRFFEADVHDASWFRGKQMEKVDVMSKGSKNKANGAGPLTMAPEQKLIYLDIRTYVNNKPGDGKYVPLNLSSTLPARDRKFVEDLANTLHLQWKTVDDGDGERHLQLIFPPALDDDEDSEDEEAFLALKRVLKRYDNAQIIELTKEDVREQAEKKYEQKFQVWKDKYYKGKFEWGVENEKELTALAENYVQGLQWVLFYYYRGVASWPWFYQYHYSPLISDVRKGLGVSMDFKLGQPFRPYQQLMGVLPDRSKTIVPECYHPLMTDPDSPIIDFYPRDFELDMNGKKMEWEAVVKIPFIQEDRLLKAMATKDHLLTEDESRRNDFGTSLKFTHSKDLDFVYQSSMAGVFPDIPHCHCVENIFDLPTMDGLDVHVGLIEGVKLGASALAGFPSLHTITHAGALDFAGVSVFQQESRNESMVISILNAEERTNVEFAKTQLGKKTFVGYPFLSEAKIVRVSDELFDYTLATPGMPPMQIPHSPPEIEMWRRKAARIEQGYAKRLGVVTGDIESLVHIETLKGMKRTDEGATVKEYGVMPGIETDYASQMVVDEVISEDQRFLEEDAKTIEEEFPIGARAFCLGSYGYGRPLEVISHKNHKVDIWIHLLKVREPEFAADIIRQAERVSPYTPSYRIAQQLGLNSLVLSRLTSAFSVNLNDVRQNLGLNLKFEAKKLKVLGYSRRSDSGWEFSQQAISLIQQYMLQFPDFIAAIQQNPKGDIFNAEDLFPSGNAEERIKAIQNWLKSIESKSFEKVPLDADQLDSEVVALLQTAADQLPDQVMTGPQLDQLYQRKKLMGMPRNALLKPADAEHRLGNQHFAVGHRVIYVQESGRVPIAMKGTVVGMTRTARTTLLDVLFDKAFMSGTTLNDRCQPFRGSTVPVSSVLNLTHRQLEVGSQASQARLPAHAQTPMTVQGGYGAPGVGGRGQLVPAGAPAPMRGSFRGALTGFQGGMGQGRGRGGAPAVNGHVAQRQQAPPSRYFNGMPAPGTINGSATKPARGGAGASRGAMNTNRASRGGPSGHLTRNEHAEAAAPAQPPVPNPQGFTIVDRTDPKEGVQTHNPNFRPRAYHNVAPPQALDAAAGNRGRGGRGRGRGGRGAGTGERGRGRGRAVAAPAAN